ncbi:MAG: hypothetical protein ABI193_21655 [Minicystis sp.]
MSGELGMPGGQLSKLLYGDRKPGRAWTEKIREKLGIDAALWDQPPAEPFTPPAASPAALSGAQPAPG